MVAPWLFKRHTWAVPWYDRLDNKTPLLVKPRGGHAAIGGFDLPASQAEEAPEGVQENLKNPRDSDVSTPLCGCPQLSEVKQN